MSNEYVVDESPQFLVECNGIEYTAIVRYYSNGDCDISINDDWVSIVVWDAAWEKAEQLGLIAEHGNAFDAPSDHGF